MRDHSSLQLGDRRVLQSGVDAETDVHARLLARQTWGATSAAISRR